MSNVLPLFALTIPEACTSRDAVTTDAVGKNGEILGPGAKQNVNVLVVADGASQVLPDLAVVAPLLAQEDYGTSDPDAVRLVKSWSDFDTLMQAYANIGILVLLVHDMGGMLELGTSRRGVTQLTSALAKPGMPKIESFVFDGCKVGIEVSPLLDMAEKLQLRSITAWPVFVGFAPVPANALSNAQLQQEMAAGLPHVLGPKSVAEATRLNLVIYGWLQEFNVIPSNFPSPNMIPPDQAATPADYRTDQGYYSRQEAQVHRIDKSKVKAYTLAADYERAELLRRSAALANRPAGSGLVPDPRADLLQVIIS